MIGFFLGIWGKVHNGGVWSLGKPRSKVWRQVRLRHLDAHPECAVCGRKENVVPHHIVPVHIDPSKELDLTNLITLCEGPAFNCHLFFGHLRDWSLHNPNVAKDADEWRIKIGRAKVRYLNEKNSNQGKLPTSDQLFK